MSETDASAFLEVADQFQLGGLETERPHPATLRLADEARHDLPRALDTLRRVDLEALICLREKLSDIAPLHQALQETLRSGNRVFLCGCGATGRLSLSLEVFCRAEGLIPEAFSEQVVGFMAGGDAALIRSIERFEDRPTFGERQLRQLGFSEGDLLVASTEGGETPFVIGATEAAKTLSSNAPFFAYANPDDLLRAMVERSKRVLEDPGIHKLNVTTGPMALSGSTRMQASTVIMAAIGWAFRQPDGGETCSDAAGRSLETLLQWWRGVDLDEVTPFIEEEANICLRDEFVLYEPGSMGITVLTDTTERSPTFALAPFEHRDRADEVPSFCYLHLPGTTNAGEAWKRVLHRTPRTLEWGELRHLTGAQAIEGFDFSDHVEALRRERTRGARHHRFQIEDANGALSWKLGEREARFPWAELGRFERHLALKMLLNAHSTLVMGRLGRYEDNVMTYVSATNNKLIDRAVRYARQLLQRHHGCEPSYEAVVRQLFEERARLATNESMVLRLVNHFANKETS